jgi:hypothetical protein
MKFSEFLNEELNEAYASVQVIDVDDAVKELKKAGVKSARPSKKIDDEVEFNLKDKKKAVAWMLDAGFDKEDIEDMYPELLESEETYKEFFAKKLKKYGVKSPSELSDADKKKFYDEVDAEWEGEDEELEEAAKYKNRPDGKHNVRATVCYIKPMTGQRECEDIYFASKMEALGFKDNVKGFPKGAEVEAIKEM